jgi:hypothetical protein
LIFHVFDIENFDLKIGFPIEKFLTEVPTQGRLDFRVGKEVLSVKITGSKHGVIETSPDSEWIEEVKAIIPGEFPESFLDENNGDFIEEEAEPAEPIDSSDCTAPPKPPIELKPLPDRLRYVLLHMDTESPVIISDKLTDEESRRLITILEKHRAVFGYSFQDLKGISPSLYTHHTPVDSEIPPSREPQGRLNNAMKDVVKKEVLKLLHARIIYPVPYSEWVSPVQVVPKKRGMTTITNEQGEQIAQRLPTSWSMCIDYRKLNVTPGPIWMAHEWPMGASARV